MSILYMKGLFLPFAISTEAIKTFFHYMHVYIIIMSYKHAPIVSRDQSLF